MPPTPFNRSLCGQRDFASVRFALADFKAIRDGLGGTVNDAVLAVVAAVAVWQWRAHRGPVLVAALTLGSALGALAAAGSGTVAMRARYGVLDVDAVAVTPENRFHYFTEAPSAFFGHTPLQMAIGVLVPAAVAAAVYALFAVATARDDPAAAGPRATAAAHGPAHGPTHGPAYNGRRATTRPVSTRAATVPRRHMPR